MPGCGDRLEHVLAVALELCRADSGDLCELLAAARAGAGDRREDAVVEDVERRDVLALRPVPPPQGESVVERRIGDGLGPRRRRLRPGAVRQGVPQSRPSGAVDPEPEGPP